MFFPRQNPPSVTGSKLLGLRASLNTPVLATEELPPGPAEAAIVVLAGRDGTPSVTIAARSVKSGALAFYAFEGPLDGEADLETALDGALSFGESMGFLFDDDALAQGDAASQRVLARWLKLLDEAAGPPPVRPRAEARSAAEVRPEDEGVLDDGGVLEVASQGPGISQPELVLDRPLEPEPPPAAAARPAAEPSGPLALTKFRRSLPAASGEKRTGGKPAAAAPRGAETPPAHATAGRAATDGDSVLVTPHGPAVGRVQLVKQRRDEIQATALDPLLRLLALL